MWRLPRVLGSVGAGGRLRGTRARDGARNRIGVSSAAVALAPKWAPFFCLQELKFSPAPPLITAAGILLAGVLGELPALLWRAAILAAAAGADFWWSFFDHFLK